MILIALDCDGSIEVSQGPIPVSLLYELVNRGHQVIIVSPSPFCVGIDLPHYSPLLMRRHDILINLKNMIIADRYVYVGDNLSDEITAQIGGWEFIYASEFSNWVVQGEC